MLTSHTKGTSSGLGHDLVHAALERGDKVIATARQLEGMNDLVPRSSYVQYFCFYHYRRFAADRSDFSYRHRDAASRLHKMKLDVTATFAELREIAAAAVSKFGQVDVVVNNAGAGCPGLTEESGYVLRLSMTSAQFVDSGDGIMHWVFISVEGYQWQFNVNFFGPINITNAFLPYMRARRSGTIVFVSSRIGRSQADG